MSLSRQNPLSTEVLGRLESEDLHEQVNKLVLSINSAMDSRTPWINKQERLLRQRRGIRQKKAFPWPGANNHNWPLTDAIIRRWKPGISSLILNADPVTYFHPTKPDTIEAGVDAQNYYHHQFHQIPDVTQKSLLLTDWIAQHGRAYTRQGWDFRTRKACRVVRADSLFPNGPQEAHEATVAAVEAQRQQAEQAVQQGQAGPEVLEDLPEVPPLAQFVRETIQEEYQIAINEGEDPPMEAQQVEQAATAFLQGAKFVKFYYQIIEADRLAWEIWNPMNVIIPPRVKNLEDSEYVVFIHHMNSDDLLRKAADGHFDQEPARFMAQKLESKAGRGNSSNSERSQRGIDSFRAVQDRSEGINPKEGDMTDNTFEVWEVLCKLDIDDDGIKEKVVMWLVPGEFTGNNSAIAMQGVLAMYPHAFPFEEWNVVAFDFEKSSDRPYSSRGVAEMVSVFQAMVNKLHNARLDAIQIILSPMFTLEASGPTESLRRNLRFMPGMIIPLPPGAEFKAVQTQATDILQSLTEENFTKSLAEQYIGVFDPGVLQNQAAERRTATEVEAVLSQVNSIASSDASLFQANMAKVHRQLWKLLMDFGPEDVYFRVMGEDQPKLMTKAEIDHEYEIVPAGTPINTQKQLVAARAREALSLLFPDTTGLINKRELYRWFLSTIDNNMSKRILRSEQDAAAIQAIVRAANEEAEEQGEEPGFTSF